jgi:HAD superfamily hydrolase (TIGR01509 family)
MLRAIIFDFNGIILNDEPIHFIAMRDAVAELGIKISREEYWERYLPFDDQDCLTAICNHHGRNLTVNDREATLERKRRGYRAHISDELPLFPGVEKLIRDAQALYPLALASGANREEILAALGAAGLESCFRVIVGAEDFERGKPNPESYLLALGRLQERLGVGEKPILPAECLVIEDSLGGVDGALAAGMKCLAVTNTYPRESLSCADRVVESLESVTPHTLAAIFEEES